MTISSECSFDESHRPQETKTLGASEVICDIPFGGTGPNQCHPGLWLCFCSTTHHPQLCGLKQQQFISCDSVGCHGVLLLHMIPVGRPKMGPLTRLATGAGHRLNGSDLLHVGPSCGCGTYSMGARGGLTSRTTKLKAAETSQGLRLGSSRKPESRGCW